MKTTLIQNRKQKTEYILNISEMLDLCKKKLETKRKVKENEGNIAEQ
jgi:hypothetical protein